MNRGIWDPGQISCVSEVKSVRSVMVWFWPGNLAVVAIRGEQRAKTLGCIVFRGKRRIAQFTPLLRRVRKEVILQRVVRRLRFPQSFGVPQTRSEYRLGTAASNCTFIHSGLGSALLSYRRKTGKLSPRQAFLTGFCRGSDRQNRNRRDPA